MLFIRLLWRLVRLPWRLARLLRRLVRLLRRLFGRRWLRRLVLWFVARQVRKSGWRGTAKFLFRGRRHVRALIVALWRSTIGLFRLGRRLIHLIGWIRAHKPRALGQQTHKSLRARVVPRLAPGEAHPTRQLSRELRNTLPRRVAHRRDVMRRSLFAAVGIDPNWRPARRPPRERA
jgi:hypothetical protein